MTQQQIYHMNEHGQLEPMQEEQFDLEDRLQELVANYPELLSGEQMDPNNPRRFILIDREQGIADVEGAADRWAVDHLLIDQDAIPTLVEVKRSTNSEIRRTIVGQMLDYAAHAIRTLKVEAIRGRFESRETSDDELAKLLQSADEPDADKFWQQVETNLRAARLRLLFVADGIPDELTQVVEFLNGQMPGIEVLAVEIKQFRGETGRTLVPQVIGRTADSSARSSSSRTAEVLNEQTFIASFSDEQVRCAIELLFDTANKHKATFSWSPGGVSIRKKCLAWIQPVTVAWLYVPEYNRGIVPGRLTFGAGSRGSDIFERAPANLLDVLGNWVAQFKNDSFTEDVSGNGLNAWAIDDYKEAAANIDVLAERLDKVLRDLQHLEPMESVDD